MSRPVLSLYCRGHELKMYDDGPRSKVLQAWRAGYVYEYQILEDIYQANHNGLAIDVGAGIGNHTVYLTKVCDLVTLAFDPDTLHHVQRNCELNDIPRHMWYGFPVALGTGHDDTLALDDIIGGFIERVAVMKIDVEGQEPDALWGARQTIKQSGPTIYAEQWHQQAHDAIAAVLEPLGYRMTQLFRLGTDMGKWEHGR